MSDDLHRRHQAVIPSWVALNYAEPMEVVSGEGRRVTASDGRTYLDLFAGILTNMLGYSVPEVNEAIRAQLDSGVVHTSTLYLIRSQVELAERIAELSGIPDAKVFFTTSGTEANECALLVATQYRRSNQVLALRNSYHGRSYAAMGVTGNRGWSASSLTPVNVSYAMNGSRYRSPFAHLSDEELIDVCTRDLREVIETTTAGDVACLVAEPIQGVGGFTHGPDGLFASYKKVLDETGILFVSDEVQTGWGRTGEHFWGIGAHGVTPDAMTFAKGLANGLSIGGVVTRNEVMDSVTANSISTFGGNPLATRAALAVLDYVRDHDLQANAHKVGTRLKEGLRELAERLDVIGDVRGKGLMLSVDLVQPGTTTPNPAAAASALEHTRRLGVLVGKGGLYGNCLRLAPPLTLTEAEADEGLEAVTQALEAVDREVREQRSA